VRIEHHSIGFVPLDERYGNERRLFTIWFSINLSVVSVTVGALGVEAGLGLFWTVVALILGNAVGTVFMAAHSAQGPHLGIPQMIQSRAQFGVIGAAFPLVAVLITYTLYSAANVAIVTDTIVSLAPIGANSAMIVFAALTLAVAFIGYELIHRLGAYLAVMLGVLLLTAAALLMLHPSLTAAPVHPAGRGFPMGTFIATVTQATAWSLTYGPYVADYSRYLRPDVSIARTFWFTACGNFFGSALTMSFGAFLAANFVKIAANPGVGLASLFGPGAALVKVLIILGVFQGNVMNIYSGYMAASTIFTGFRGQVHMSNVTKLIVMATVTTAATAVAILTQKHFDQYFGDMHSMGGRYGRVNIRAIMIYLLAIAVQIPFVQTNTYTGAVAKWLGAEVAWIPGLILPALLYYLSETRALRRHIEKFA
jgi:NCS1 family nucleobase:cation symporter-1